MEFRYRNVILRDMREADIADEIRWNTLETQWAQWDAPWESLEELKHFDSEAHRRAELEFLKKQKPTGAAPDAGAGYQREPLLGARSRNPSPGGLDPLFPGAWRGGAVLANLVWEYPYDPVCNEIGLPGGLPETQVSAGRWAGL